MRPRLQRNGEGSAMSRHLEVRHAGKAGLQGPPRAGAPGGAAPRCLQRRDHSI